MRPSPPPANAEPGTPEQPGLSESAASFAVLGVNIETLGAAVARHWGLGEDVQHMIHRLPRDRPARTPDSDADMLRTAASAANDAVDAVSLLPATRVSHGLGLVAQRYARAMEISVRDLQEAMQTARVALRSGSSVANARTEEAPAQGEAATESPPFPSAADAAQDTH